MATQSKAPFYIKLSLLESHHATMKALLFEPACEGHRLNYVRLLVPALYDAGFEEVTWVTTAGATRSPEYETLIKSCQQAASTYLIEPVSTTGLRRVYDSAQALGEAVHKTRPDRIYVPYADGLALGLALSRLKSKSFLCDIPIEGLQFRGGFAYETESWPEKLRYETIREISHAFPWTQLHQLDPWVDEALNRRWRRPPGIVMPDPVEPLLARDRNAARNAFGLQGDDRVLGITGALDARKGVDLLIKAFSRIVRSPNERLLLAGKVREDVRDVIKAHEHLLHAGQIVLLDDWLSCDDFEKAICAADWIMAPYPRHIGSSSIVLRAAAAGRKVIGSDFGWVSKTITRFSLGHTCDVQDEEEFASVLRTALDTSGDLAMTPAITQLMKFNSPENFQKAWTYSARQDVGAPIAEFLSWQEVLQEL